MSPLPILMWGPSSVTVAEHRFRCEKILASEPPAIRYQCVTISATEGFVLRYQCGIMSATAISVCPFPMSNCKLIVITYACTPVLQQLFSRHSAIQVYNNHMNTKFTANVGIQVHSYCYCYCYKYKVFSHCSEKSGHNLKKLHHNGDNNCFGKIYSLTSENAGMDR